MLLKIVESNKDKIWQMQLGKIEDFSEFSKYPLQNVTYKYFIAYVLYRIFWKVLMESLLNNFKGQEITQIKASLLKN